jgi:6-phosphogluconolactonase (cycloisomerase 2 family)
MQHHRLSKSSRREFLEGAVVLALTEPAFVRVGKNQTSRKMPSVLAYVGSYSSPQGPEGTICHGQGIYLLEMDAATGALRQREVFPSDFNPSWLALDPSRTHLYSANEISNYKGTNSGSVSAYLIDPATGHLTLLNTVSSEGASPAHISVHPSGKYVFVANYQGGTVAVLPVRSNGELGVATDVKQDSGTIGSTRATSGPPGSFAISGHDKPHAHMIQADPAGEFVLASDLGLDQIFIWKFDVRTGRLSQVNPASVPLPPGDGHATSLFIPAANGFTRFRRRARRW